MIDQIDQIDQTDQTDQTDHLHAPVESRKGEKPIPRAPMQLCDVDQQRCDQLVHWALEHRATQEDIRLVTEQLGRYPRGIVSVVVRCTKCNIPIVVAVRPLITDHVKHPTPFPTTFYVTNPVAVKAISRLEATGVMNQLTERLQASGTSQLLEGYQRAHAMYLRYRHTLAQALHDSEEHIAGVSAGGMPTRVKCLHALVGQSLAMGPGVNPIGDWALRRVLPDFAVDVCSRH
jgi:hypothetical protein